MILKSAETKLNQGGQRVKGWQYGMTWHFADLIRAAHRTTVPFKRCLLWVVLPLVKSVSQNLSDLLNPRTSPRHLSGTANRLKAL